MYTVCVSVHSSWLDAMSVSLECPQLFLHLRTCVLARQDSDMLQK